MARATRKNPAKGIVWNLDDLYSADKPRQFELSVKKVHKLANAFADKYTKRIKPGLTAKMLYSILVDYEAVIEEVGRLYSFAMLKHSADSSDESNGALLQRVREEYVKVVNCTMFFELDWVGLNDKDAKRLIASSQLQTYSHYLAQERKFKMHRLTEPEEKIMSEMGTTGGGAFARLFDEILADVKFTYKVKGKTEYLTESEILGKLYSGHRTERKSAAKGLTTGLKENSRVLRFIFNNLVHDHTIGDRLRNYSEPISYRNLSNEVNDATVETMMQACESAYPVVQKYYRLKQKLLGVKKLYDYDRYAPLKEADGYISYQQCQTIILDTFYGFHETFGATAELFFEKNWIDAELRPGKRSGAFSASTVPGIHPYILVNYTGRMRDVVTVAHELGHGIHQYLSRPNGVLQMDTPLVIAEMASTFGEMLVFNRLLKEEADPAARLGLICSKLEDNFATIFRQVAMTRFEQGLHQQRREQGELSEEAINTIWMDTNKAMFKSSVDLTDDYSWWWLYIPHFIHSPFYCYSYAFAQIVVLSLYAGYNAGTVTAESYMDILTRGGSEAPATLLKRVGLDIEHADFWKTGLSELDALMKMAQKEKRKV